MVSIRKVKIFSHNTANGHFGINAAIAETGDFASGVIKVVNEELEKQGKLELTAADIRQQKMVAWTNAQGEVGEKFLWLEKIWNKFSIDFAGDVQE